MTRKYKLSYAKISSMKLFAKMRSNYPCAKSVWISASSSKFFSLEEHMYGFFDSSNLFNRYLFSSYVSYVLCKSAGFGKMLSNSIFLLHNWTFRGLLQLELRLVALLYEEEDRRIKPQDSIQKQANALLFESHCRMMIPLSFASKKCFYLPVITVHI